MKRLIFCLVIFILAIGFGLTAETSLHQSSFANSPPKVTKVAQVGCKTITLADIVPIGNRLIPTTNNPTIAETGHAEIVLPTQFKGEPRIVKRE